jgi:hypothetical protein
MKKKLLKIFLGLILMVGTVLLTFPGMVMQNWGYAALNLIKGGITLSVLLVGLILVIMGITELKD